MQALDKFKYAIFPFQDFSFVIVHFIKHFLGLCSFLSQVGSCKKCMSLSESHGEAVEACVPCDAPVGL